MDAVLMQARAARGARHFDRVSPGWDQQIDRQRLDIASHEDCVIAQLTGAQFTPAACAILGIVGGQEQWVEFGVIAENSSNEADCSLETKLLTVAWLIEIQCRAPFWSIRRWAA